MSAKVILYDYDALNPGITIEFNYGRVFYYYNANDITVLVPGMFKYYGRI